MNYIIIGRGGHGKDTVKDFISNKFEVKQARMAYFLKDIITYILDLESKDKYKDFYKKNNKWYDVNDNFISVELLDILKDEGVPYIDKENGFSSSKDLRMMMIHLGTEYLRKLDNDINIKTVGQKVLNENNDYVFTDIRFKNEFDFVNSLSIEENKKELSKYVNNYNIKDSFNELKKNFINIVLGYDVVLPKNFEKRLDFSIKRVLKLNTGISYDLSDINLTKRGKKNVKILKIFRIITNKDFNNQKKIYTGPLLESIKEKLQLDCNNEDELKKAMEILGFIRPGFENPEKVFHPSEFELGLKKPYYEYKDVISASSLDELEKKVYDLIDDNQINNETKKDLEIN